MECSFRHITIIFLQHSWKYVKSLTKFIKKTLNFDKQIANLWIDFLVHSDFRRKYYKQVVFQNGLRSKYNYSFYVLKHFWIRKILRWLNPVPSQQMQKRKSFTWGLTCLDKRWSPVSTFKLGITFYTNYFKNVTCEKEALEIQTCTQIIKYLL